MDIDAFKLEYDEFLRIFKQNIDQQFSFLLGAGCSISSGIPSASRCIWEWKKSIYETNTKLHFVSIDSDNDKREIQRWCDLQPNFPKFNSTEEYSFYIEKAFSEERDRVAYFERLFIGKTPSIGYKLLALLAKLNIVPSVWTTNFDNMTLKAAEYFSVNTFPISIETQDNIYTNFTRNGLKYVALHGDYKYSKLKNTGKELDTQEEVFVKVMSTHLAEKHLIVMGYSGRDKSLMSALKQVYSQDGGGRLFWLGMDETPADTVIELIKQARKNGRSAYYIQAPGFDECMHRMVALACGEEDIYKDFIRANNADIPTAKVIPFKVNGQGNIIKYASSNLLPVIVPQSCYIFGIRVPEDISLQTFVNQRIKGKNIITTCYQRKVYAIGAMSDLYSVFSDCFTDQPSLISITTETLSKIPRIKTLFLKAILLGIARKAGLNMNFKGLLWDWQKYYENRIGIYEAVKISLRLNSHAKFLYIALSPTIYFSDEFEFDKLVKQNTCREYIDRLRNKDYFERLGYWNSRLFNNSPLFIQYSESSKEFTFKISPNTACCKIYGSGNSAIINPDFNPNRLSYTGIQVPEPVLNFSTRDKNYITHTNPMLGLQGNRPFDLPSIAIAPTNIPIGVICPQTSCIPLYNFLTKLNTRNVMPRQAGYIQPYNGFQSIYGVSLDVPFYKGNSFWVTCKDNQNDGLALANNMCKHIERISEMSPRAIVIIFIPKRWSNLRTFKVQEIEVDFHDYIKAYCAQKGVTTQFIEEKTINNSYMECEILWWLSLALFVKFGRTPWTLGSLNEDTAYAGIGYSVQQNQKNKIVVGCSHMYNSHGQGLSFRLKKIDNAIIDRKNNPYLSKDEAYKLGLNIVELFNDSMYKKPKRVVIHKRTIFKEDEIDGFVSALSPYVQDIELITIEEERDFKLIPGFLGSNITADNYPIHRGICTPIDDNTALLWTHGSLESTIPGKTYYQGGKGIPMPLKLTRCYGVSTIDEIASEILSFTKINWNSFYFYSKLPATIETSNVVANIGRFLQHYNGNTFDYKYFI